MLPAQLRKVFETRRCGRRSTAALAGKTGAARGAAEPLRRPRPAAEPAAGGGLRRRGLGAAGDGGAPARPPGRERRRARPAPGVSSRGRGARMGRPAARASERSAPPGTRWRCWPGMSGSPVRVGTLDALTSFAARPGGADALVARAARVARARGSRDLLRRGRRGGRGLRQPAGAGRALRSGAAARLPGARDRGRRRRVARRRALGRPPAAAAGAAADAGRGGWSRFGERGADWLEDGCRNARHPDLRAALSNTILALGDKASGQGAALAQRLRAALEGSAKPPRDPTRRRPGRRPREIFAPDALTAAHARWPVC